MKKIYTLALAAALAVPAFAVTPESANSFNATASQLGQFQTAPAVAKTMKAPAKAVSSMDDLCGKFYRLDYYWLWQGDDNWRGLYPRMEKSATEANVIEIYNLPFSDLGIPAIVDWDAKTFTIKKQEIYQGVSQGTPFTIDVWPMRWDDAGDDLIPVDQIVGTIDENGVITFDQKDILDLCMDKTYNKSYGAIYGMVWTGLEPFEMNEADWSSIGQAEWDEGVINVILETPIDPVMVEVLQNKTNKGLYALKNPYNCGDWAQINGADLAGAENVNNYIVFNIDNPDCVPMRTMVQAGFYMNNGTEQDPLYESIVPYNLEGRYFYADGLSYDEIIEGMESNYYDLSVYDPEKNEVLLQNIWFGMGSATPLAQYGFAAEKDAQGNVTAWEPLTYYITLPGNSGVDEIETNENAPVKYYNLQGMEVKNAAKGQIVIKAQGNKARKVVVK